MKYIVVWFMSLVVVYSLAHCLMSAEKDKFIETTGRSMIVDMSPRSLEEVYTEELDGCGSVSVEVCDGIKQMLFLINSSDEATKYMDLINENQNPHEWTYEVAIDIEQAYREAIGSYGVVAPNLKRGAINSHFRLMSIIGICQHIIVILSLFLALMQTYRSNLHVK